MKLRTKKNGLIRIWVVWVTIKVKNDGGRDQKRLFKVHRVNWDRVSRNKRNFKKMKGKYPESIHLSKSEAFGTFTDGYKK